jgi:hypothetical protein
MIIKMHDIFATFRPIVGLCQFTSITKQKIDLLNLAARLKKESKC